MTALTCLACLVLSGWIAAMAARPFRAERHLVAVTMFFAALLLAFQLLGLVELLTGAAIVTTAHAALVLLAAALGLRLQASLSIRLLAPPMPALAQRVLVQRVLVPAAPEPAPMAPATTPPTEAAVPAAPMPARKMAMLAAGTFLLAGLMLAWGRPQGFEVLAYHLPLSVHLLQSHSLQAWDGNFPHTFPANASIVWAVLLAGLPERLVSAANLLLLVPLLAAAHALCRLADADRKAALYACCGLLGVPMIAFSSAEPGTDIGGIAFMALALYFALCPLRPAVALSLAGLCAGLAFGFKSLHLIGAMAIGLLVCLRSGSAGGAMRNVAWFGGVALLSGGYWMLRNAIAFGNPLHPVGVPLVGAWLGWLPGGGFDPSLRGTNELEWVTHARDWLTYPWVEPHRHGQNFKHSAGTGAFVAALMPATAVALAAAIVRDGWRAHRVRLALLLVVLGIGAAWWLLGDRQPRYVLGALVPCLALAAWTVTQARGRWRRLFDVVLAACIVAMLGVFLSRQALQFGDRIVLARQTTRAAFYEYPPQIDTLPAGARVLNMASRSWHYPLSGAALSNHVVSMPEGRRLLGLAPDLTEPREVTLRAAPLREAGITHLFVAGTVLHDDGCIALDEAGRVDRNPVNGKALERPRVLYALRFRCERAADQPRLRRE